MSVSKKIVLVQLPVLTQDVQYYLDFLPFSCSTLIPYIKKHLKNFTVLTIPIEILALAGDEYLINWILREKPDVVGFSCFLWNIQRSTYIAKQIKKQLPSVTIIFGGPEITEDNDLILTDNSFDIGIIGEGELILVEVLKRLNFHQELVKVPNLILKTHKGFTLTRRAHIEKPIDLSPYIDGGLRPSLSNSVFLESARGCKNRCAYCFYHKNLRKIIPFSINRLKKEIKWILENGIKEVSFVDPSFCKSPIFLKLITEIKKINQKKEISFFCELNAEDCTPDVVSALCEAGFKKIEIGLQTINQKSLKAVKRSCDLQKFVEGTKNLKKNGIKVLLDLMMGLPEDSFVEVKKSIDFVVENQLFDELHIYPLLILPGTYLKKFSNVLSISFSKTPPYHVYSTKFMQPEDMFYAFEYAEEITQLDFFPATPPPITNLTQKFYHYLLIKDLKKTEKEITSIDNIANLITLELKDPEWIKKKNTIKKINQTLIEKNPYILINWIVSANFVKNIDKKEVLVFFPDRELFIDLEFFSTSSFFQSVQLFIKVEIKNLWALIRIPYNKSQILSLSSMFKKQHTIWIFVNKEEKMLEEEILRTLDEIPFLRDYPYLKVSKFEKCDLTGFV